MGHTISVQIILILLHVGLQLTRYYVQYINIMDTVNVHLSLV